MGTLLRRGVTHLNLVLIHPKQVATLQQEAATPHRLEATPHRPVDTPHKQADSHPSPVVTLQQLGVTPQQQEATLRLEATLPQPEDSLPRQEATQHHLELEVTLPCLHQVEAGVQHQADTERREELRRVTQGALHQASPCQITQQALQLAPQCLHMEVALRPTLRHRPFLKATGAPLRTFQGPIH